MAPRGRYQSGPDEQDAEKEKEDVVIRKVSSNVPKPNSTHVLELLVSLAPKDADIPEWMINAFIIAYQNGRYDEACAETFSAAFY